MSVLAYNGVTLPWAQTTAFRQEVAYDDQGGTDWYCERFDIETQTIINQDYLSILLGDRYSSFAVGNTPVTAPVVMLAVRELLMQPRKTLSFKVNGVEQIPVRQTGNQGTVDAQNGPKPQSCNIIQLTNWSFLLSYHITAHYWLRRSSTFNSDRLGAENVPGNPVLYNRWSETVEIDPCDFSTRTREGKYVIRSDNTRGFTADDVRPSMAVLSCPNGFLRRSSRYTVSPDGLGIQYYLQDVEQFRMPPNPAFEADGDYTEMTTNNGALRYGTARIRLRGSNHQTQPFLVDRAVAICASKLLSNGAALNQGNQMNVSQFGLLKQAVIRCEMFRNEVEVQITAMLAPRSRSRFGQVASVVYSNGNFQANIPVGGVGGVGAAVGFFTPLTSVPFTDSLTPPGYSERGTAGIVLQAAAYYDPSIPSTTINLNTEQLSTGRLVGEAGQLAEV